MNHLSTYRLDITTLSPVHIGTGQAYDTNSYVIEGDTLHHFDASAAMAALSPADRDKLLALVSRGGGDALLREVQRFFYIRREALMAHATLRLPVAKGVADLYRSRIGQVANHEEGGGKVINKLAVERNAYDPVRNRPVLYGSSFKGALRTAVLDRLNDSRSLQKVEDRKTQKQRDENSLELQQRLLGYRVGKFENDPFRLLQIGDAAWSAGDDLPAGEVLFAVERKRAPVVDQQGNLRPSRAEDLYQTLECVPASRFRAFSASLVVQDVGRLPDASRPKLPAPDRRFGIDALIDHCNAFYRPILERELKQLGERGYVDARWARTIDGLLRGSLGAALNSRRCFLLRVGRHSGAESVTLNGVRSIKIMKHKNDEGEQTFEYEAMPLTWWLAASDEKQRTDLLPFGWVLVEVSGIDEPAADWPDLREALASNLERLRAWAARRQAEDQRLAEQRELALAEQTAAATREAARVVMTERQRAIDDFAAYMQGRYNALRGRLMRPNGEEHDRARKLAKAALDGSDWTAEERRAAADAIAHWLPLVVSVDIKDERKKLKLAALRGDA
ncbi:MAG: RAMP superfamily CRISPR-associated protein [Pseudomonadota bacterium]